jgi:hypothetical protein
VIPALFRAARANLICGRRDKWRECGGTAAAFARLGFSRGARDIRNMMPSLLKYFTIVGGILFAGLIGINALLEPGGPGPKLVTAEAPKAALRLDPRASKVERLRAEEAAQKAVASAASVVPAAVVASAAPAAPAVVAVVAVAAEPAPVAQPAAPAPQRAMPVTAAVQPAEPAQIAAPAALTTDAEGEAARPKRIARDSIDREQIKAEKTAAKARKQRVARERAARTREVRHASAARVQEQIYYGYAPRPTYGPFQQAQGGWGGGGGWGQRW